MFIFIKKKKILLVLFSHQRRVLKPPLLTRSQTFPLRRVLLNLMRSNHNGDLIPWLRKAYIQRNR